MWSCCEVAAGSWGLGLTGISNTLLPLGVTGCTGRVILSNLFLFFLDINVLTPFTWMYSSELSWMLKACSIP